jgi:hypothetical protein
MGKVHKPSECELIVAKPVKKCPTFMEYEVQRRIHKMSEIDATLKQLNAVHALALYFSKINSNAMHPAISSFAVIIPDVVRDIFVSVSTLICSNRLRDVLY